MLTEMRKVTRGWIALGVIGLLALAFAIWGINDVFKPVQSNEVVTGRGLKVSSQEFDVVFDKELKGVQAEAEQRQQTAPTKQDAVANNFHMRVIDQLVTQRVFDNLARQVGVNSSDAMVAARIQANPAFRNQVTGAFDANTYRNLLAQNRITRTMYESDLRGGMTRSQLAQALVAGVRPPSSFGRMIMAFDTEKRTISMAAVSPDRAPPPPAPTEADLQTFYTAQSRAFALPEFRAFTLVKADPAAFEARVEVPEDKIKALYEYRKATLATPERRSFVVLSGGDQPKAEQAARRLAAGDAPDAIAAALGMQAITFTQKTKADAPDPRIGAAVFATEAGKTTGAIQSLTWAAAKVTEVTAAASPTLEDVHAQLRGELASEEAQTLMADAVEKFEDARAGGAELEAAAQQAGLTVSKTPLIEARGLNQQGQPEASVLDQPELLKAVFNASEGDPSDWISTADGGSFLVRIDTLKPTGAPPLAQIRDRVAQAWRFQKISEGMRKIVDEVEAETRAGGNFADVVRAHRLLPLGGSQTIDRRAAQQGPSPALGGAIFAAREGDVVSGIGGERTDLIFIAHVEKIERADPSADPQGVEQRRQSIAGALGNDTLATVQSAARQEAHVQFNQPLIDRLVGKTDPNADTAN